jgi:type I restriction enzyme R subunit
MQEKPWGRVVNYRWPAHNERLMNEALAIYANKDSAHLTDEERKKKNTTDGITAPEFKEVLKSVKETVEKLSTLTKKFTALPASEKQKVVMFGLLQDYNVGMAKLKQYDPAEDGGEKVGFDYDDPDGLLKALEMTGEQEVMLTTVLTNELKTQLAKAKNIPLFQLELHMTHVKDVKIDYDYLTELVERLLNEVHEGKTEQAKETQGHINQFALGLDDRAYATRIVKAAVAIVNRLFPPEGSNFTYPAKLDSSEEVIEAANNVSLDRTFLDFRVKWGITDIITSAQMRELFSRHRYSQQDLDDTGQIRDLIAQASGTYQTLAHDDEVQKLSKIKYRNGLREALYKLADELTESYGG